LHETVGEQLRRVDQMTERHLTVAPVVQHRELPADVAQVISLFRGPRMARQAIVAALILGPPRALQSE
jgi:hypothetical protein